jgi:hypothetical protein
MSKNIKLNIATLLFFIPILFLAGCVSPLGYNPPKYVCDCRIVCKSFTYGEIEYSYTFGNNTIEDTKANCASYALQACGGQENVVRYTCNPVTWSEWNKIKEKERQSSGRGP